LSFALYSQSITQILNKKLSTIKREQAYATKQNKLPKGNLETRLVYPKTCLIRQN